MAYRCNKQAVKVSHPEVDPDDEEPLYCETCGEPVSGIIYTNEECELCEECRCCEFCCQCHEQEQ